MEVDKKEFSQLEVSLERTNGELAKKGDELKKREGDLDRTNIEIKQIKADLEKYQQRHSDLSEKLNTGLNENAILSERGKQQASQLKEKDTFRRAMLPHEIPGLLSP